MTQLLIKATNVIAKAEGFRKKPYLCSEGKITYGHGIRIFNDLNINNEKINLKEFALTITKQASKEMLVTIISKINDRANKSKRLAFYKNLTDARKAVLISMIYQMGFKSVLKFKKTLLHFKNNEYEKASVEMLNSKWAKQTPVRAKRHAKIIKNGYLNNIYESF